MTTGWQGAAIQPQTHASGWVVRNVSALRNGWAGLMAADGMKILGGHYNDNDQLGIGGNAATGVRLRWPGWGHGDPRRAGAGAQPHAARQLRI